VLVFYANNNFFSLLKKAVQHLTGIYLMYPFATRLIWSNYSIIKLMVLPCPNFMQGNDLQGSMNALNGKKKHQFNIG